MRTQAVAQEFGHSTVEPEHLLLALLEQPNGPVAEAVTALDADPQALAGRVRTHLSRQPKQAQGGGEQLFLGRGRRVMQAAVLAANQGTDKFVGAEHLFLAIMAEGGTAAEMLSEAGINPQTAARAFKDLRGDKPMDDANAEGQYQALERYSVDLTELAREGKLDPVIGREDEILRVMEVLSRRTKNNPVLIGEPGVGKTAIVEGLAQTIADGDVPEPLQGKRVLALDLAAMVAGSKFRGEFEERLKAVMDEIKRVQGRDHPVHRRAAHGRRRRRRRGRDGRRQHAQAGPGARRAAVHRRDHAGRVPQAHRARPGAGAALRSPSTWTQPYVEDAIEILTGPASARYEEHHNLKITDEALEAAVQPVRPLHPGPLPARQGHRPDGRGGLQGAPAALRRRPEADRRAAQDQAPPARRRTRPRWSRDYEAGDEAASGAPAAGEGARRGPRGGAGGSARRRSASATR